MILLISLCIADNESKRHQKNEFANKILVIFIFKGQHRQKRAVKERTINRSNGNTKSLKVLRGHCWFIALIVYCGVSVKEVVFPVHEKSKRSIIFLAFTLKNSEIYILRRNGRRIGVIECFDVYCVWNFTSYLLSKTIKWMTRSLRTTNSLRYLITRWPDVHC